jgi:hypothetical protein
MFFSLEMMARVKHGFAQTLSREDFPCLVRRNSWPVGQTAAAFLYKRRATRAICPTAVTKASKVAVFGGRICWGPIEENARE